jgi:hypothetical protein
MEYKENKNSSAASSASAAPARAESKRDSNYAFYENTAEMVVNSLKGFTWNKGESAHNYGCDFAKALYNFHPNEYGMFGRFSKYVTQEKFRNDVQTFL